MRILTVRQPWAWAIIHGGKDVENRTRSLGPYRGPVAIHAASGIGRHGEFTAAWAAAEQLSGRRFTQEADVRGAIIGVVDLVDVHSASVIGGCGNLRHDCPEHGTCREHCSPWAEGPSPTGWMQHLVVENPRALDEPIPRKGGLGLRKSDLNIIGDHLVAPWGHGPGSCTPYGCEPGCEFEPVARLVATS